MKKMTLTDKFKYLNYKLGIFGSLLMILLCIMIIAYISLLVTALFNSVTVIKENLILFIFAFIFFAIVIFLNRRIFIVLLSKKLFIVDGKISKKRKHRYPHDTIYPSVATATSNNKYKTEWIPFKEKYFKYENIPVNIIIKNDKGFDFYITDFSFKNKN